MNKSLVTIIIPCYNNAIYLNETLESVYSQTYSNWECIIINDGSTDDTSLIAAEWLIKDKRFRYIETENKGVCSARNIGIDLAKGKYILPLDSDDMISKDYLDLAVDAFFKDNELKLVYCNAEFFGIKQGVWKLQDFSLKELAVSNIIFCSGIYKKEDCLAIGKYDINLKEGLEDWEFWINLLKDGGKVYKIPEVCFYYRQSHNTRNVTITNKQYQRIFEYISKKHVAFYVEQFGSIIGLIRSYRKIKQQQLKLKSSKKEVLNLFCKTFFSFKFIK